MGIHVVGSVLIANFVYAWLTLSCSLAGAQESSSSTTLSTTPPTTTTEAPLTCSTNTSACPRGWFRAERDVCVMVETVPKQLNTSLEAQWACSSYGTWASSLNAMATTAHTTACIKARLAATDVPLVLLGQNTIWNFNSNERFDVNQYLTNYYGYYHFLRRVHFVCFVRKLDIDFPKIVKFSLTVTSVTEGTISTQDLLQTNGTLLVPIRRHNLVSFTCQSSSDPPPKVWLQRKNHSRALESYNINSSTIQLNNVSCTDSAVFTCTAINPFNKYNWLVIEKDIQFIHARPTEFMHFQPYEKNVAAIGAIPLNADVSLWCSINACPRPSVLTIEDSQRLPIFSVQDSQSVQYEVRLVHCQDMGPYICAARTQDGGVVEVRTELVVNGRCPVQPCRGEPLSRVLPAALGETVNISLCILTYPAPSVFYDLDNPRLSVNLTKTPGSQLVYTAHLTLSNIQHSDYKTHSLVFNNVHGAVVFNVSLGPEGPPPCPTVVTVTGTGLDYVSLSWHPGEDEGMLQTFHVFYSVNNRTWRRWEVAEEEGSEVTVSGLKHDTGYFFRVVASNEFFLLVNQTLCPETVRVKTASIQTAPSLVPTSAAVSFNKTHRPDKTDGPSDLSSISSKDIPLTSTTAASPSPGSPPTISPDPLRDEHARSPGANANQQEQTHNSSLNYLQISLPIVSLNVAVLLLCALMLYINRDRLFSRKKNNASAANNCDKLTADGLKYNSLSIKEAETSSTVHLVPEMEAQAATEM